MEEKIGEKLEFYCEGGNSMRYNSMSEDPHIDTLRDMIILQCLLKAGFHCLLLIYSLRRYK